MDQLKFVEDIKGGCFSTTVRVMVDKKNRKYVLKRTQGVLHGYNCNESTVLKLTANCPAIVKMHEYYVEGDFEYILTDYVSDTSMLSELYTYNYNIPEIKKAVLGLVQALRFLHKNLVIYGDLKPENVMLENGQPILVDFGLSTKLNYPTEKIDVFKGTDGYLAPEIHMGRYYGYEVDYWALGVMCYEMYTGDLPFKEHTENALMGKYSELTYDTSNLQFALFVDGLLQVNRVNRLNDSTIVQHRFLQTCTCNPNNS